MADIPNPRLKGVMRSRPSLIFRYVCDTLRGSERLQCVETWKLGESDDTDPEILPTPAQCPFVRLSPRLAGGGLRDNISQRGRLLIDVYLACKGFDVTDSMDLFNQVINVVYPSSQTEEAGYRQSLLALGAVGANVDIEQPASAEPLREAGIQVARGTLGINIRIQG